MIQQIRTATAPPATGGCASTRNGQGEEFFALFLASAGKSGGRTVKFGKASAVQEKSERRGSPDDTGSGGFQAMTGMFFYIPGDGGSGLSSAAASQAGAATVSKSDAMALSAVSLDGIAGTGSTASPVPASGKAVDMQNPLVQTGGAAEASAGERSTTAFPSAEISELPKDGRPGQQTVPREHNTGQTAGFAQAASPGGTAGSADAPESGQTAPLFVQMKSSLPVSDAAKEPGASANSSLPLEGTSTISSFEAAQTAKPSVSSGLPQGAVPIRSVPAQAADIRAAQTPESDAAQVFPAYAPTGNAQASDLGPASGAPPVQTADIVRTTASVPPMSTPEKDESASDAAENPSGGKREYSRSTIPLPGDPASADGNRETVTAKDSVEKPAQECSTSPDPNAGKTDAKTLETGQDAERKTEDSGSRQTDEKATASGLYAASPTGAAQTVVPISDASTRIQRPVLQQVTDQIVYSFNQNKSEFQMELYPEHLGKVSVKLSMENSTLTVSLSADSPKTQSLLMSHAGHIQSMLQNTVDRNVQVTDPQQSAWYQQDQGGSRQQPQQQQAQQQTDGSSAETGEENSAGGAEDFLTVMQRLRMQVVLS